MGKSILTRNTAVAFGSILGKYNSLLGSWYNASPNFKTDIFVFKKSGSGLI